MVKKAKHNFTEGPLFWELAKFALPIMLTSVLQLLYNTADKVVVGQFSGDDLAVGAIGSTAFISGLITNFMIGVGAGVGVLVAQLYGAGRREDTSRAVHSSVVMALCLSLSLTVVALVTAQPLLLLLDTREELMPNAVLYLNITYLGLVGTAVYNIGASILRAVGDSKTPLVIGMTSGLINVVLNIVFVVVFKMSVAGVAIATIASQYYSAIVVMITLARRHGEAYQLKLKEIRADGKMISKMLRLGIPTGLQSCCFSFTNLFATHAVNQFPTSYVTARSIALDVDHIVGVFSGAFMHSALTATGQNYGAGNAKRVVKVFLYTTLQAFTVTFIISQLVLIFRAEVAALFVSRDNIYFDEIIAAASEWCGTMLVWYFSQGVLNAVTGAVRGMGYSVIPLVLNIIGTCVVRLCWIFFVFPLPDFHTFAGLAMMYPMSWAVTAVLMSAVVVMAFVKLSRQKYDTAETPERGDLRGEDLASEDDEAAAKTEIAG